MDKNPETRCGKNGLKDIKALGFYSEFDWSKVLESSDSPLIPLKVESDHSLLIPLNEKVMDTSPIPESSSNHIHRYSFANFSYG